MELKEILNKVREFQLASEQDVLNSPETTTFHDHKLRSDLMYEENEEYFTAACNDDIVEVLDACVDMLYILAGTINHHGLHDLITPAFELIHDNNMTKLVNGKVLKNEFGKVIKPEGYKPVDLTQLF